MYPNHKNKPIIIPGFHVIFLGTPPIKAKKNAAIIYLKNTTKVGLKIRSDSDSLTEPGATTNIR